MAIRYRVLKKKDWEKISKLSYPPNVAGVIKRLGEISPSSIIPASELMMKTFSTINQVNQAFIQLKEPYRLRIIQGAYYYFDERPPLYDTQSSWPIGCLLQLCVKL